MTQEANKVEVNSAEDNSAEGNNVEANNAEGNNAEANNAEGNNAEANNAEANNAEGNNAEANNAEDNNVEGNNVKETKVEEKSKGFWAGATDNIQVLALAFAICTLLKGTIAEARFIPSGSMEPTLQINDRLLVEKLSERLSLRPVERGDILVFYPPPSETGVPDDNGWLRTISRMIPLMPENPPAFIKRVVGLPGDRIVIKRGIGVYVNGKLLDESKYVAEAPDYDLTTLGDFGGVSMTGKYLRPYGESDAPIVVPDKSLLMLGDNRNNSADGHVWGFLKEDRIVGRACLVFWKSEWLGGLLKH